MLSLAAVLVPSIVALTMAVRAFRRSRQPGFLENEDDWGAQ